MTIQIQLFGMPRILKDGEEVLFPYNKINAMIYYLAVNGTITRTEIAGLLWPEDDENIAKKNLRNAIYVARRYMGLNFIISPKKSKLQFSPSIDVDCDATQFADNPEENLALYQGDFLQGFYVKNTEQYDDWITRMRGYFREKYMACAYRKLEESISHEVNPQVEKALHRLVAMDEYDERNIRLLMRYYAQTGRAGKVIETYYNLKQLLMDELGVSPDTETQAIYEAATSQIEQESHRPSLQEEAFFYGRYRERALLAKHLNAIAEGKAHSFLIEGEAGIGKTALVEKALEEKSDRLVVLKAYCYQAEQSYALRPFGILLERMGEKFQALHIPLPEAWERTMEQLFPSMESLTQEISSSFVSFTAKPLNADRLTNLFVDGIKRMAKERPVLVLLEDVQWMDNTSIQLLSSAILRLGNRAMFLLTTRPESNPALEDAVAMLSNYDLLTHMPLRRFNREETYEFMDAYSDRFLDAALRDRIYTETEGNPFFLAEYLQVVNSSDVEPLMTEKMKDTMKARFAYLSKPERDLVDLVSCFYDEALISTLNRLTGRNESDLIGILQHLEQIHILKEETHEGDTGLRFTHVKLREYIYLMQPPSKRRLIHKRIAQILEQKARLKPTLYLYSKMVYHYTKANEPLKAIQYELETLNFYLNFSHELFPILHELPQTDGQKAYLSRDKVQGKLSALEEKFEMLRQSEPSDDLNPLEMQFFFTKGRYLIREGAYIEGLADIRMAIDKAKALDNKDYVLEGYKQFIFYHIQTNQPEKMIAYIESALELAVECNYHKEIGILLRLKGLYFFMMGKYETAVQFLNESKQTFRITPEVAQRYAINIAAVDNYLGEILFQQGRYSEALEAFDQALSLSQDKNALSAMSIFYINKGKALYALHRHAEAHKELLQAKRLYGQMDSIWKRPVLESYLALCEAEEGDYAASAQHMQSALKVKDPMHDPRALGTAFFAAYELLTQLPKKILTESYSNVFDRSATFYGSDAIELLDKSRDHFELSHLPSHA